MWVDSHAKFASHLGESLRPSHERWQRTRRERAHVGHPPAVERKRVDATHADAAKKLDASLELTVARLENELAYFKEVHEADQAKLMDLQRAHHGEEPYLKLLYVTPERVVKSDDFGNYLTELFNNEFLARFVIDEAHWYDCTSIFFHVFPTCRETSVISSKHTFVVKIGFLMVCLVYCLIFVKFRTNYAPENDQNAFRKKPN